MIIREIEEESEEYPFCPKCKVPLYFELKTYRDVELEETDDQRRCNHEYYDGSEICLKCGHDARGRFAQTARLMRCPKCAALYHVE